MKYKVSVDLENYELKLWRFSQNKDENDVEKMYIL